MMAQKEKHLDEIDPTNSIMPIVMHNEDGTCGSFLGTGAFIEPKKVLVTCDHVLVDSKFGYAVVSKQHDRLFSAEVLFRNPDTDLALLRVTDFTPDYFLPLREDDVLTLNEIVMCFEYGTTEKAGSHVTFAPANRIGNVTRFLDLTKHFKAAGDDMLELSFPALRGASGAPVMDWRPPFRVWGVVTKNWASELAPAQIETILDEKGQVQGDTKFYLPQALAIHVKHVRAALAAF
jgi:hypothetical protein